MATDPLLFDYDLPRELIAQQPLRNRADARLMLVDRKSGDIRHLHVRDLPDLLSRGDRLVLNDTFVTPAQLQGRRLKTGGRWQGLYLSTDSSGHWKILCKTRGKLQPPEAIMLIDRDGRDAETLWLIEKLEAGQWLAHPESDSPADQLLERVGRPPLPHYIRGGRSADADFTNYQTIFAQKPGAVAAPTAGLHFTRPLLQEIDQRGVGLTAVTLHVGLGTFRPINGSVESHTMHSEWCELSEIAAREINKTRQAGGRIVAVGTTCVRTLESAAQQRNPTKDKGLRPWSGKTDLFIKPPYEFRAVDAIMTNFHFPGTTLLVLAQAFGGSGLIRKAYDQAVKERYRFYSYGDTMLIL